MNFVARSLLVLLTIPTAFAVDTRQCPQIIESVQEQLGMEVDADGLLMKLRQKSGFSSEQEIDVRVAFQNARSTPAFARRFKLTSAENGRCRYSGNNDERFELFTEKGQHALVTQIAIGPQGILMRTYAKVLTIEPKRIALASDSAATYIAVPRYPYDSYSVGGPLVRLGYQKVTLTVW